jgi:hypothetical protein
VVLTVPLWPADTAIQLDRLVAVQLQPLRVVTSTASRPPAAAIPSPARLKVNSHGAAAWLTATLCAPTVIAPAREDGTGLGATVYGTDASPCPPASSPIDTQVASVLIDHVQSRDVAIVSDPFPPAAVNPVVELLTLTWHLSAVGAVSDVVVLLQPTAKERVAPATASATAKGRDRQRMYHLRWGMHVPRQHHSRKNRLRAGIGS